MLTCPTEIFSRATHVLADSVHLYKPTSRTISSKSGAATPRCFQLKKANCREERFGRSWFNRTNRKHERANEETWNGFLCETEEFYYSIRNLWPGFPYARQDLKNLEICWPPECFSLLCWGVSYKEGSLRKQVGQRDFKIYFQHEEMHRLLQCL